MRHQGEQQQPGDRQLFENIKSVRTLYTESYIRVLRLSREGKREEALDVIRTQLIPLRDAFLNAAEVDVMWNKADADAAHGLMAAMNLELDRHRDLLGLKCGHCRHLP